ncbi:hypothetical protein HPB51_003884 [Rhipicephalus microplus]|uniref:Uncharacterized protein n=1 Tax=Rhipicephalus microplus TaxID=6941 RepID=A0A9J6EF75_RHIMP|nr:hypothetical protein HPB51_003884 [Rhipicephalus microplus]
MIREELQIQATSLSYQLRITPSAGSVRNIVREELASMTWQHLLLSMPGVQLDRFAIIAEYVATSHGSVVEVDKTKDGAMITKFDSNYLNMNGSIHVCWHPNDDAPHFHNTEERIFLGIFNYIDFVFRMIEPNKTFFMAVDGVAPRAKMNQQRGRTFKQVPSHRHDLILIHALYVRNYNIDSAAGTNFMARLQDQLLQFVAVKVSSDTLWRGVNVCLSGHEVCCEGGHNVMDFIRTERSQPSYDPNTRHCLYGLDANFWCVSLQIMLGMCSHEPHFALLREEIMYGKRQNQKRFAFICSMYVPEEITFHLLRLSLLREYLELESQELKITIPFNFKMDNSIDDWVLMCFLVANDFLSHLPNLHIAHNVRLVFYQAYIDVMPSLGGNFLTSFLKERAVH